MSRVRLLRRALPIVALALLSGTLAGCREDPAGHPGVLDAGVPVAAAPSTPAVGDAADEAADADAAAAASVEAAGAAADRLAAAGESAVAADG
ncbi:MAG TPA: hypothetical protein VI248_28140 [Kineosporiaceae bacterium]